MDNFNLTETRKNIVAKDNRMIQNSRMAVSLMEHKALIYLISKIKPNDEPNKIYVFNCKEFQALLRWNKDASYQNIKIMLQNLGDVSWWIESEKDGRKKEILMRWFNIVHMDPGTGNVDISFHEDMFPYLLELHKHFEEEGNYYTRYMVQNVALMKHRYSVQIYELLKSYQYNNKKWTFENGTGSQYDLQRRIADTTRDRKTGKLVSEIPESWSNWAVFKRDVLNPAVEEINKYTDIKVAYEGKKEDLHHRKTRAIRTIEFYMARKTVPEQRITDKLIDDEYDGMEDSKKYHQLSIEELFFAEHEKSLKVEQEEREYFEAMNQEKRAKAATHPALFEELNKVRNAGFDEKKVNQLFSAAIKGRVVGEIHREQWELFATDLIVHYFDKIEATSEETKTTTYKRLLNSVENDYDNEAFKLISQYGKG